MYLPFHPLNTSSLLHILDQLVCLRWMFECFLKTRLKYAINCYGPNNGIMLTLRVSVSVKERECVCARVIECVNIGTTLIYKLDKSINQLSILTLFRCVDLNPRQVISSEVNKQVKHRRDFLLFPLISLAAAVINRRWIFMKEWANELRREKMLLNCIQE